MRLLVDMDGVLADFEGGLLREFRRRYAELPFIPIEARTSFYAKDQYPSEHHGLIEGIYFERGFFLGLDPIPGSLDALPRIVDSGRDVYICTSPLSRNPSCIQDKCDWVQKHLGKSWLDRLIVIKDKALVDGDILIDDRPDITGARVPSWEHVLYTQPYNLGVPLKRRLTWADWRSVLN